jgi:hypothetical protein
LKELNHGYIFFCEYETSQADKTKLPDFVLFKVSVVNSFNQSQESWGSFAALLWLIRALEGMWR